MFRQGVFLCLFALAVAACQHPGKKGEEKTKPEKPMADVGGDVAFQAFANRLRKAVATHDVQEIAPMMTADFGYRLDPPGEGEGVFQYWDEKALWGELNLLLRERFTPKGNYMVVPPQFASDDTFTGYRAGVQLVNGSWKFAYFVKD